MSMKIGFDVKWGHNEIELPINQGKAVYEDSGKGLSRLKNKTFTIINCIPTSESNPQIAEWRKYTLKNCGMQSGIYDKSAESMVYKANTWTAWLDDWQHYKSPTWLDSGYYALPDKSKYYTANIGDLLIFEDIPDETPRNTHEFKSMAEKYKNMGGIFTAAQAFVNYRPNGTPWRTNHIEIVKG